MGKKIFLKGAISPRQDTLANWTKENPILENGEMAIVTDSKGAKWLKLGDGVTPFCDLPYKETEAEVDKTYNSQSENAQSGKAVAEAINGIKIPEVDLSGYATKEYVNIQLGDISTALDEIHTYAQALVNGGATV